MVSFILMTESTKDLLDKVMELNKTVLECALDKPFDILGCINERTKSLSPTYAAMHEFGVGEFDLTPEDILIDGIVVDAEKAMNTPCKCVKVGGRDLCWSPGIIGMLRQDQIARYCPTKHYEEKPKFVEHLKEFKKIAEETKGMPLPERIAIMREYLEKKGKKESPEEKSTEEEYPVPEVYPTFEKIPTENLHIELSKKLPEIPPRKKEGEEEGEAELSAMEL